MARRRKTDSISALVKSLDKQLAEFGETYKGLTLREKVIRLVNIRRSTSDLGISVLVQEHGFPDRPAIERIKVYLVENAGEIIDGEEIAVVAGISEWGRRVRQLRVEDGYRILTGASPPDEFTGIVLDADQYMLAEKEPDHKAARRWKMANRIRKDDAGGSQGRILAFLQMCVGEVITTEELAYVAKASEYGRRTRELRTEHGYAIATRFTGRPDLKMGEYILESAERVAEPHDRHIPDSVQREVYERDLNTCQACRWVRGDWMRNDPRFLELHHRKMHRDRGSNTAENLVVLCSKCHDDVHAGRISGFVDDG